MTQDPKTRGFWRQNRPDRLRIRTNERVLGPIASLQRPKPGPKSAENREIRGFHGKSSMGTQETVLDIRSVVAARHARSLRSSRALRVSRALLPQRPACVRRAAPPFVPTRSRITLICSHLAAPPPVRRCIFLLVVTYNKIKTHYFSLHSTTKTT